MIKQLCWNEFLPIHVHGCAGILLHPPSALHILLEAALCLSPAVLE